MEKAYKTMKHAGALSIALGIIVTVTGIVAGVLMISSGGSLLANKRHIVW